MKFAILIFIIFVIIAGFRFINNMKKKNSLDKKNENVVDLEKDPKTDEYKPKEYLMLSLQSIIMKIQTSKVIESLKETFYWIRYGF